LGNPSSAHDDGLAAAKLLVEARKTCAEYLGAKADEIVFTSGATEADNLALKGVFEALGTKGKEIIIGAAEHPAIIETAAWLGTHGGIIKIAPVDRTGAIDVKAFEKLLSPKTILVSVAMVNHEVGTLQPLREMVRVVRKFEKATTSKILFHTDASAASSIEINVQQLGVDLLTLDSTKFGGPSGAGILYVKRGTLLAPQLLGGGQEGGRRAGTENLPAIAGFGVALAECQQNLAKDFAGLATLRTFFLEQIQNLPVVFNGSAHCIPNLINLYVQRDADYFVQQLNARGIAVSARSACRAGARSSDVLRAMGFDEKYASECIRISFGAKTKKSDLGILMKALQELLT
jgi:cysteine desulfurase